MAHDIGVLIGISQAPSSSDSSTLALVGQLYSELERMPPLRALPMPTPATIQALIEKLRGSVNVLHLYTQAHASGRQVTISLQAEDGKNATIDSKTFSHVLRGSSVPLAILSASGPADDPSSPDETHALLEFALQLVVAGTPAVLAVPTTLSERTGQLFWQEFYRSIVQRGQPLDLALGAGRMALWQRRELTQSWYMPTLFAAADEDALWPFGQYGPAASAQQQWIKSLP